MKSLLAALLLASSTAFAHDAAPPTFILTPTGGWLDGNVGGFHGGFSTFTDGGLYVPEYLMSVDFGDGQSFAVDTPAFAVSHPYAPGHYVAVMTLHAGGTWSSYEYNRFTDTWKPFTLPIDWTVTRNFDFQVDGPVSHMPEPATYAMLLAGFGLIGFAARRRA
jgi:hypothetical protein